MTRPRPLRQLLVAGATLFATAAGVVLATLILLFLSLQRSFDRDTSARLIEKRAADEIVRTVYAQIFASYQQLQAPSNRNMERFDALDSTVYTRLRQYLFLPMPLDARLQVETIKELHQTLEVEAQSAFDYVRRGDVAAARARVAEMQLRAEALQKEMDHFVALRDRERDQLHEQQVALLRALLIGVTLIGVVLIVFAALFVRLMQRRVLVPLGQLATATVQLGGGDLTVRVPEQQYDELDRVARSFNAMADGIRGARMEIEQRNLVLSETIQNLNKTQQELVQQEKLSAMGFMLAGLAHELNNPLAGILGSAQCVEDELRGHADPAIRKVVHELVTPLVAEARRAGDLVRNLLQFSRKSNAQLESVNLKTAIDVSAGLRTYAFAQAGKELRVEVPDRLFVAVEAQRLEHVAINIMSNALDAMCAGGGTRMVVSAEAIEAEWVSLTFEDDGPGFREPDRVFDAFYTTKAVGTATGLGLALVHRFVTDSGGTISAENVASGGARLTLRLRAAAAPPLLEEAPASVMQKATDAQMPLAIAERKVLIVDDEPAIREIQRRFLSKIHVQVLIAKDGAEAVAILQRERCDVVVTDIRMPGEIDGIALYEWIERNQPNLAKRCLFVTGDIGEWGPDSVIGGHPERVLTKPFDRETYIARVQGVLDRVGAAA